MVRPVAVVTIMVASAAVFPRILTEMAIVAPNTFWKAAPPLGIMIGCMVLIAIGTYYLAWARVAQLAAKSGPSNPEQTMGKPRTATEAAEPPAQSNPAELLPALIFGGLYALVLLGAAAAHDYLGPSGLYTVAVISGLHDLDAITLSTARFVEHGQVEPQLGWRLILAASLSNLVFKVAAVVVLGAHRLPRRIAAPYAAALLGGMALLLLWSEAR